MGRLRPVATGSSLPKEAGQEGLLFGVKRTLASFYESTGNSHRRTS